MWRENLEPIEAISSSENQSQSKQRRLRRQSAISLRCAQMAACPELHNKTHMLHLDVSYIVQRAIDGNKSLFFVHGLTPKTSDRG